MKYEFVPMTREYAHAIVDQWKYNGECAIYDYSNEAHHILDTAAWGVGLFAVLDGSGKLVSEVSIEFSNESNQYIEYEQYSDHALIHRREMWIGFGPRPDPTDRGLGSEFVAACVRFAVARCNYRGETVRLGVAAFNRRAIKHTSLIHISSSTRHVHEGYNVQTSSATNQLKIVRYHPGRAFGGFERGELFTCSGRCFGGLITGMGMQRDLQAKYVLPGCRVCG
jgi:ribosomal-protein-alanine N-acetyltransferase